jgi:hypothetical protein
MQHWNMLTHSEFDATVVQFFRNREQVLNLPECIGSTFSVIPFPVFKHRWKESAHHLRNISWKVYE